MKSFIDFKNSKYLFDSFEQLNEQLADIEKLSDEEKSFVSKNKKVYISAKDYKNKLTTWERIKDSKELKTIFARRKKEPIIIFAGKVTEEVPNGYGILITPNGKKKNSFFINGILKRVGKEAEQYEENKKKSKEKFDLSQQKDQEERSSKRSNLIQKYLSKVDSKRIRKQTNIINRNKARKDRRTGKRREVQQKKHYAHSLLDDHRNKKIEAIENTEKNQRNYKSDVDFLNIDLNVILYIDKKDFFGARVSNSDAWSFKNNKKTDVMKYVGEIKNGIPNGYGILSYVEGNKQAVFDGYFVNGKREGHGVNKTSSEEYDGMWKNNQKNGHGIQVFPSSSDSPSFICHANFKNDIPVGNAILEFEKSPFSQKILRSQFERANLSVEPNEDLKIYKGGITFKDGKVETHGHGFWVDDKGKKHQEGHWENGKLIHADDFDFELD